MLRPLVIFSTTLMLAACTAPPPSVGAPAFDMPDIAPGAISETTMKDVTRALSSDAFEGRAPGTAGEEKTLALLTERFAAAGLVPGNHGSWFQQVPLVEITASNPSALTIAGGAESLSYDFGTDFVALTYREVPQINIVDSDIVFVGYGINAPERGWNDYAGLDVAGKTVVILVNDPDFGTESLKGPFGGKAMTYYGRWTYKFEEAARQGAAAALIVHDTAPASYGWNVVEGGWSGPQFYAQSANDGSDQTMANGWVQKEVARQIFTAAGEDLEAMMAAAKQPGFKPVDLGLTASLSFDNSFSQMASNNVIGVLEGATRPDEYILYTAHWDHLGRCTPVDGDDICNGAIDNATGTAALVAIAEAQAAAGPPDRSLVFLAVTAEESGLLGADYYAANPVFPLDHTVGGVNMDAFPITGPSNDVTVVGPGKSQLDDFLAAALQADGRYATPNPQPEAGLYYRSDHFAFAKRGVPMLYFEGGEDLREGGRAAGAALKKDYDENRYHAPSDEFDENWDWSGVMQDLQLYFRIGRALATSTSWPNWVDGDEFRAVRDAACAGEGGC